MNTSPQSMPLRHGWRLQVQIRFEFAHFVTFKVEMLKFARWIDEFCPADGSFRPQTAEFWIASFSTAFLILADFMCEASVLHRQDRPWSGSTLAARVEE
jgi:hypothetical protein